MKKLFLLATTVILSQISFSQNISSIPYLENFESNGINELPKFTLNQSLSSDNGLAYDYWTTSDYSPNSSSHSLAIILHPNPFNPIQNYLRDCYFFTPLFYLNKNTTYTITFFAKNRMASNPGMLTIKFGNCQTINCMTNTIASENIYDYQNYHQYTHSFTPAKSGYQSIAFEFSTSASGDGIFLDDISISQARPDIIFAKRLNPLEIKQPLLPIQLFPNPVESKLFIALNQPTNFYLITDGHGRLVKKIETGLFKTGHVFSVDVSFLKRGIYYITQNIIGKESPTQSQQFFKL